MAHLCFCAKYRNACEFNNIAVKLLERGHFQLAHDTTRCALSILHDACQCATTNNNIPTSSNQVYHDEKRRAHNALLCEERKVSSMCHVEALIENQTIMPSSIFNPPILVNMNYFEAYPVLVMVDSQTDHDNNTSLSLTSDFDFHCTTVLYNFALCKLCLYFSHQGSEHLVVEAIQLLRLAFDQLGRVLSNKEQNTSTSSADNSHDDESTSLSVLCALLLSNLARALPLIAEIAEAQEMSRRLSMMVSNNYFEDEEDHHVGVDFSLFDPIAAPAA